MIGILDYGLGNILAFVNMYKRMHFQTRVVRSRSDLDGVTMLILPGVGAFDHAMNLFNKSGLREPAEKMVREQGTPLLGICVGMQMLAESSEEGELDGLGWIPGKVTQIAIPPGSRDIRLPHMGWNNILTEGGSRLFRGLEDHARFYFLHSYHFETRHPEDVIATVEYGARFPCAVARGHIMGVQFHPEKSHCFGAKLLQNFAEF